MDKQIPLGPPTEYLFDYDASLLFAVPRQQARDEIGISGELPFQGVDIWTAYELSWLNTKGLPQVAIAEVRFACDSPNIVESKSFKLYLNSLNQTVFTDQKALIATLEKDLSACSQGPVEVQLFSAGNYPVKTADAFTCLDGLDISCSDYLPKASLLEVSEDISEQAYSTHVFRSLCPVTGQPDWASMYIHCHGKRLAPESLLRYLVSFRQHQGFHEQCAEMIFQDIHAICQAKSLTVNARFLRRGGLDINTVRSIHKSPQVIARQARQ